MISISDIAAQSETPDSTQGRTNKNIEIKNVLKKYQYNDKTKKYTNQIFKVNLLKIRLFFIM